MRVQYIPQEFHIRGGHFVGYSHQRGAGLGAIFRGLFRYLMPIVKNVGKSVGTEALRAGAEFASDVVAGESVRTAAEKRARAAGARLLQSAANKIQPTGGRIKGSIKGKKRRKIDILGSYHA